MSHSAQFVCMWTADQSADAECGPSTALPNQPRRPRPFSRQPSTCLAVFTHTD